MYKKMSIVTQNAQTTVYIPAVRSYKEVDVHIDTNVTVSRAKLFSNFSIVAYVLSTLLLVVALRQQSLRLCLLEQELLSMGQHVNTLTRQSNILAQRVLVLQDRLRRHTFSSQPVPASDVPVHTSATLQDNSDSTVPDLDVPYSANETLSQIDEGVRLDRTKRSNRRGNQKSSRGQRGHLHKRNKIRGPSLVHLKGAVPEICIEDGGLIAPWYVDEEGAGDFQMTKYELRQGKGAVRVTEKGLYYIYAQVYYLTTEESNSYSINLQKEGKDSVEELALCSTHAAGGGRSSEVSCFTSVVRFLNTTDLIYVRQRERNRRMILRDGYSFFGVVHLNSVNGRKANSTA
ncbi:uncharacterized protein [Periplaneta americana]|uniref:uncharacterized protein isoform X2 n=1 Tax=Periplaneta americana TaxID=6978 RepID=UPI0037E828DB